MAIGPIVILVLVLLFLGYRLRRHWVGWVLLVLVAALMFGLMRIAQTPLRSQVVASCVVSLDGADIYVGNELLGRGMISFSMTGKEKYCLPLRGGANWEEQVRQLVPDATPLDYSGGPLYKVGGNSYFSANCLARRSDGTLDSFLVVTGTMKDGTQYAILLRFRREEEYKVEEAFMSVSYQKPWEDLVGHIMNRTKTSRAVFEPEIVLTAGTEDLTKYGATSWWLAGFPAGISDLTEPK